MGFGRGARWLAAGLVLSCYGCNCGDGGDLGRVVPLIRVAPAEIDFGDVPDGATKFVSLAVENIGQARLTITALEVAEPFGVDRSDLVIEPGVRVQVDVWFRAREEAAETGVLVIRSNAFEADAVEVPLRGRTVPGFLELRPSTVDFSETVVGTVRSVELVLQNRGIDGVSGQLQVERFPRPTHFALTGLPSFAATAAFGVAARSDTVLELEYRPLDLGLDHGRILFSFCGDRCGVFVEVAASGVQAVLEVRPTAVDFGPVGIGASKTAQVVLTNTGQQPLHIGAVEIEGTTEVVARPGRTLAEALEAGASLPIVLEYAPTVATGMLGELLVRSDAPGIPEARVPLRGSGEGPLFEVSPTTLAFGVLRDLGTARRSLLMLNAGSAEVSVESIELEGDPAFRLSNLPPFPSRLEGGASLVPTVSFTPNAVREYEGRLVVRTTDPNQAEVVVPILGAYAERLCELDLSPARLNFGLLPLGYARTLGATVRNVGDTACELRRGAFASPLDAQFVQTSSAGVFPLTLDPGQSRALEFRYTPEGPREGKATFAITTGDDVYPDRLLSLVGSARLYEDMLVLPREIDFGARKLGCRPTGRLLNVINSGTVDQTIERVSVLAPTGELTHTARTPARVPAGGSAAFEARYQPVDVGFDAGLLEISVAGRAYPFVVPLRGEGRINASRTDVFEQRDTRKADVLFVIDDSCSMQEEQLALSLNFGAFIGSAAIRNVDFQIGITTTTVESSQGGALVGPILKNNTPGLEGEFARQANVGIRGSGREQGLEAMLAAFQKAEQAQGHNRGLIRARDDSVLGVIIVSDEDDQSPASVLSYYRELLDRATSGYFVATVTGGLGGCQELGTSFAVAAPRYDEFARLTSGYPESICSLDWSRTLTNLGDAAFGLRRRFNLTEPADTTFPIVVSIDGVVIPSARWTYEPAASAISFAVGHAPPAGSTIEVEYYVDCQ